MCKLRTIVRNIDMSDEPTPKFYFKNEPYNNLKAPPFIRFEKALITAFNLRNNHYKINITKIQENILLHF